MYVILFLVYTYRNPFKSNYKQKKIYADGKKIEWHSDLKEHRDLYDS